MHRSSAELFSSLAPRSQTVLEHTQQQLSSHPEEEVKVEQHVVREDAP